MNAFETFWSETWSPLGGNVAAVLVLGNLFTWFLLWRSTRHAKLHTCTLQTELTNVTSDLSALKQTQAIALAWLHEQKAEVMVKLYAKLAGVSKTVVTLAEYKKHASDHVSASGDEDALALLGNFFTASNELHDCINEYAIFLNDEMMNSLSLLDKMFKLSMYGRMQINTIVTQSLAREQYQEFTQDVIGGLSTFHGYLDQIASKVRREFVTMFSEANKSEASLEAKPVD